LVESHSTLVRRSTPERQQKALNYLRSIGVNVICDEKIVDFNTTGANLFLGSSGRPYRGFDKVYLATGTTPCSQVLKQTADVVAKGNDSNQDTTNLESCVDNWDRICVKPTLQLKHWKYQHIFAGGDVTNVKEEKTGYAATLAGVCIARNICRMEKGKQPLDQGAGGTLPAPMSPLHGKKDQGGIGRGNTQKKT
jgi:NADH dehydrogenase FAD-containing subunit